MTKTLNTALAIAVLAGSAMFASASASQAGYYGGGYGGGYGYNNHYYQPSCFYKKIKVWGYYGYHWKTVKVCH